MRRARRLGSVEINAFQQDPAAHQPVGINGPAGDLRVFRIVVVLHLVDDIVVELLEVTHQGQGDLLIFVGVGVEGVNQLQHLLHLGAGGFDTLFVAVGLVVLHGD